MSELVRLHRLQILSIITLSLLTMAFIGMIVTLVIPKWIFYDPIKNQFPYRWFHYKRIRGILQECVDHDYTINLYMLAPYNIGSGFCIFMDFGQYSKNGTDSHFVSIKAIRQSQLALFGVALLVIVVVLLVTIGAAIYERRVTHSDLVCVRWRLWLTLTVTFSAICLLVSVSLQTALLLYFEKDTNYKSPFLPYSQFNINAKQKIGPIFILAWVNVGVLLLVCILFYIMHCLGNVFQKNKYESQKLEAHLEPYEYLTPNSMIFLSPSNVLGLPSRTISPNSSVSPNKLARIPISNYKFDNKVFVDEVS